MRLVDVRSLRQRDFRIFFLGQFVSLIGSWMQSVAQGWLVFRLTGDPLTLGAVSFLMNIPVLILGPAAGWVADRFPRRTTVVATHVLSMFQAGLLAWLTLRDEITVGWVFALAVVFGISNAFEMPSRQSLIGDLVGRENMANAIALNSSMINVTRIVGPAIAGIVVGFLGEGLCFLVNALSFIAALFTLIAIHVPPRPAQAGPRAGPVKQMIEGLNYVRTKRPIAGLLLLLTAASFTSVPSIVLLPVFAKSLGEVAILGWVPGGPVALGILQAAAGVGAFMGAITLSRRTGVQGFGHIVVYSGMIAGAGLIVFSVSPWLPLAALLILPVGYGSMRVFAAINTLLQSMVPDALRGRVMSFYSIMLVGMAPFGSLAGGACARAIGAPWTGALFGAGGLAISALALWRLPTVAAEAKAMLASAQAVPEAAIAMAADLSKPV